MRAASQLPGKGPLMWMMPLHLHVNQKSDYDDEKRDIFSIFSIISLKFTLPFLVQWFLQMVRW